MPWAQPLWFGQHVLVENKPAAEIFIAELPALAKVGINSLIVEVDNSYEYAFRPGPRADEPIAGTCPGPPFSF